MIGEVETEPVILREMQDEDISAISRVVCDSFEWGAKREGWSADRIEEYSLRRGCERAIREQFHEYRWQLACSGGSVLGVVAVRGNEIAKLYVSPDRMREGIGTALFGAAEEMIRCEGHRELVLGAVFDSSIPFYESVGMAKVGRKSVVLGTARGADAMIMKKPLPPVGEAEAST